VRRRSLLVGALPVAGAIVAGTFLVSSAPAGACAGRLAPSLLSQGSSLLWQDSKTRAVFVVSKQDALDPSGATVQEFDGAVYDNEIRFETPDFMHLRELDGQRRDWYRIVRDLLHARCAAEPGWVAAYMRHRWPRIDDEEDWTYAAAQRHVRWRLYWAGRRLRGLPFESFHVTLTPRGIATGIGLEYLSASEHGIILWEARAGSHDARLADRALRRADAVAPGILLAHGSRPAAARIGSTSIYGSLEPIGAPTRREWMTILRRLRPAIN